MGLLLVRLVELLIVVVPVVGLVVGAMKAFSAARVGHQPAPESQAAQSRAIARTIKEHDRTDTRWLDYELDIGKLLDFPLMTDMRNPLTERFHRAKLRADLLRPAKAEDLLGDSDAARDYLDAVENYVTAFDIAETEAIRKRRNDFTKPEQQRLADGGRQRRDAAGARTRLRRRLSRTRRPDRATTARPIRHRARNPRRARRLGNRYVLDPLDESRCIA
jgi:hypothetical protein